MAEPHHILFYPPEKRVYLYIEVQGKKYTLPASVIERNSEALKGIFQACAEAEAPNSEENPCIIPGVEIRQWDSYCYEKMNFRNHDGLPLVDYWEGVLVVASLFVDDEARTTAIQILEGQAVSYRPARRVAIARRYHIEQWLEKAFRELIKAPASSLTPSDIAYLDADAHQTYLEITKARESLITHRQMQLLNPGELLHDGHCPLGDQCQQAWDTFWRIHTIILNHPTEWFPFTDVLAMMRNEGCPAGMHAPCWGLTMGGLEASEGLNGSFSAEEEMIFFRAVEVLISVM